MPKTDVLQPAALPTPAVITPALLKTHSITAEEYTRIETALGRTPSLTELGIFSVMWSEHCSYKNTRPLLKGFPTEKKGPTDKFGRVLVKAGEENADPGPAPPLKRQPKRSSA